MFATAAILLAAVADVSSADRPRSRTVLGIDGPRFTLNGRPEFLLGASYYGGLGARDDTRQVDFDKLPQCGFNWIRVWATWAAFGQDVSAVEPTTGEPRQPYLQTLQKLVGDCDQRGVVVDVTISRGKSGSAPTRLPTHESHRQAVRTVVEALRPYRNWYLDLSNERNIGDSRHASTDELRDLRQLARRLDPDRLVTASHGGDIGDNELRAYLKDVGVDFIAPHRPRDAASPTQTEAKTRDYLKAMRDLGRVVPVHYQEPFRRGYDSGWQPSADDFSTDLAQARAGGAAGWCFHNGDQRDGSDSRPRRSFDLSKQSLFEQLDADELRFIERLPRGDR
ncbi:MAG TPA: hypothetical protein VG826_06820 [Pirellulales bacterium]|nr:hypothetical protein [Pirellulales bacterium]